MGFSLSFASAGKDYIVTEVYGNEAFKKHLHDLEFVSGAIVHVVSAEKGGLTLKLGSSKLALDRTVASKIYVRELENYNEERNENDM